ncbi:hypothetical protein [Luteimonas granuli]|nr:hypothetical protein [Luteimonas granuli]
METTWNESLPVEATEEARCILAVASVETRGGTLIGEDMGGFWSFGIAQD